ncbi:MAG: hypothetical protein H8K07_01495 [Nitrospira sp.]|nr:hypothetical protein [Nitrospira sp.]
MHCLTHILQSEHYQLFRTRVCTDFQRGRSMEQLAQHYRCHLSVIEFVIRDGLKQERKA